MVYNGLVSIEYQIDKEEPVTIKIDACVSESHSLKSQVTSHPTEYGTKISDHISPEPRTVQISGVISDCPISGKEASNIAAPTDALENLKKLHKSRTTATLTTSLERYERMALQSLDLPRSSDTGKALEFTATLVQIEIVKSEISNRISKAQPTRDAGRKCANVKS